MEEEIVRELIKRQEERELLESKSNQEMINALSIVMEGLRVEDVVKKTLRNLKDNGETNENT